MGSTAGTNAWRKVEGVTGDRRIYHVNVKETIMLSSCVTPAYLIALETMAQTEKQQNVHVCEKNYLVRRIVLVKRADKRIIYKRRLELVKESFKKLVRCRLTWSDHVGRMRGETLAELMPRKWRERHRKSGRRMEEKSNS